MLPFDLFLVRHFKSRLNELNSESRRGDSSGFTAEVLRRHSAHFPLTDQGKEQPKAVGQWLNNWLKQNNLARFDHHVVSESTRALESAAFLDLPEASWHIDPQLRERDHGIVDVATHSARQEILEEYFSLRANHRFYTPLPFGESMADVCDRLRVNIMRRLQLECGSTGQRVVIVSHGEVMQAFRIILEEISADQYHELNQANTPDVRIGNGQIIHYTRIDPTALSEPKRTHYDRFGWVRSFNPWCPEYAGHDWREIKRPSYSNAELLALAERYGRLKKE